MRLVSIINMMCMIFTVAQNCSLISGTVGNSFSGTSRNDSVIRSGTVGNSWEQFVCSHIHLCVLLFTKLFPKSGNSWEQLGTVYLEVVAFTEKSG